VSADARVAELGLEIPESPELPFRPRLVPVLEHAGLAYLSGIGPIGLAGVVGRDLSVEEGYDAARATGLSMLASLKQELGELDRVKSWLKALGFVNCGEGFNATPSVINGFSDLVLELWGDAGRHARSAIGSGELPFGIPVEVEAVVALG
jgi:enamine deaminase RidA (YjgF/YER057c/UK114 family)